MKQAYGNWVTGNGFWDREKEIELFIEQLEEGANILIVAQRRIGKTSLMRETAERMKNKWTCLQVDLQKSACPEDVIAELAGATFPYKNLWSKTTDIFRNIFECAGRVESLKVEEVTITLRDGLSGGIWQKKGNRLFSALAETDTRTFVFFDEVPIMVNRMLKGGDYRITPERREKADLFLSWLREKSVSYKGKVGMVLTGSIGFEPILKQAGLSATITTFQPFELKPWDEKTAIGCLQALAAKYGVSFCEGVCEHMVEKLGCCIPHHVQMYFTHIYETCRHRDDMVCTIQDAEEVYIKSMLSTRGHAELSHFEERLKMVVGDVVLPFVLDILTEAAVVGHLSPQAAEISAKNTALSKLLPARLRS